jgi:glycosyltransferase involved in cell wall biosynthesis
LLNLGSKINFVNYTSNVLDIIMKHDVYLQGSFVEGFPNALLESCSVGIPAIAFNVPGGTREIIQDGINGILVNDIQDFIKTLNNNILLRSFDNNIVRLSVQDNFNATKIINKYEVLFNSL